MCLLEKKNLSAAVYNFINATGAGRREARPKTQENPFRESDRWVWTEIKVTSLSMHNAVSNTLSDSTQNIFFSFKQLPQASRNAYLESKDGQDGLVMHEIGVAKAFKTTGGKDLESGLGPDSLTESNTVLDEDLGCDASKCISASFFKIK